MGDLQLEAVETGGSAIAAILDVPAEAWALFVFGHGAGAGMRHEFMVDMARRLGALGLATLRYEFPYMTAGRRRVDAESVRLATVRTALAGAAARSPLPVFAGGKSMGGRMTSALLGRRPLVPEAPAVRGLVFFGFPLHPAKEPSTTRAEHLPAVEPPMLFLQGTRDALADLGLITATVAGLGPRASLHVVQGADHGFDVLKRSGRIQDEVRDELATTTRDFCRATLRSAR